MRVNVWSLLSLLLLLLLLLGMGVWISIVRSRAHVVHSTAGGLGQIRKSLVMVLLLLKLVGMLLELLVSVLLLLLSVVGTVVEAEVEGRVVCAGGGGRRGRGCGVATVIVQAQSAGREGQES